jgi:ribose transport system ATP-binding protein
VAPYVSRLTMKVATMEQDVAALSGGTQQKVITARALLSDSDLLIMDEPTAGIDVHAKEEIYALVDELKARGKAIIVIASDFAELIRMSDRVVTLSPEGRQTGHLAGPQVSEPLISRLCFQLSTGQPQSGEMVMSNQTAGERCGYAGRGHVGRGDARTHSCGGPSCR